VGITTAASKLPALKPGEFRFVTNGLQIQMEPAGEDAKGRRRFKAIASSTEKDLRGDEMQMSAMQDMVTSFKRGLNVFMDHNHTAENVFGRTDTAEIRDSGQVDPRNGARIWDLHVAGAVNEPNKKAMELADSIDGGYVSFGTSIGAFVTKFDKKRDGPGRIIEHVDCKELSVVGLPMNQRAWTYKSADGLDLGYQAADANWTMKAADASVALEQNALFDGDLAETPAAVETFAMAPEATPEAVEAPQVILEAEKAIDEPVVVTKAEPVTDRDRIQSALAWIANAANDQTKRDEVIASARAMHIGDADEKGLTDEELLVFAATDPEILKSAAKACPECGGFGPDAVGGCHNAYHSSDEDDDGDSPQKGNDPDMDGKSVPSTELDTTAGGQEASEATPETAPADPTEPDPAPEQKALAFETADVVELVGHVRTLTGLLDEKEAKLASLMVEMDEKAAEIDRLTADNDEARVLIEKVMAMPLRRRAVSDIQTFSQQAPDFLAPAVRRLLQNPQER
jgi:hypothetical protein